MLSPLRALRSTILSVAPITGLLLLLSMLGAAARAQTTVSGTVYMPNGTDVLPNALVYLTTTTPPTLVSGANCPGANCLTAANAIPSGAVHTKSAVDGTFTLTGVAENTTYTLVIQAGHWRRQFSETVVTTPLTGLTLSMPSTHAQGDIPLIAVNTGAADAVECVFRHLGVSPNEVTDDTVTTGVTFGGRIHLYRGDTSTPGAEISASTPTEASLMEGTSTTPLNHYDIVMFPCQGTSGTETATHIDSLLAYTSAGGRAFLTHLSRNYLNTATTYMGSTFSGVANWSGGSNPADGVATVNTGFPSGSTLAQWLYNGGYSDGNTSGAPRTGTLGQVDISTLRWDLSGVYAPTQSWLTLNNAADSNPVMQFSFNAPFGAAAASQYGRVMFNEYHVENVTESGAPIYPAECPNPNGTPTPQEKMLDYALFDLSNFVNPVVVPTVSIVITTTPSNSVFKEGDNADLVNVDVTNTSSTVPLDSSVVLSVTLPPGLTATAVTDASGGWSCTLATLLCTRTANLAASASDSIAITVSVDPNATNGAASTSASVSATVSSPTFSSSVTQPLNITFQRHAAVTWDTPAAVASGTALSSTELNAVGNTTGTYVYSPVAGTVLSSGPHTLSVTFTPSNAVNYPGTPTATVVLTVNAASIATVTLTNLAQTYTGSPLPVTETTSPTGLTVNLLYTGTSGTTYGPSAIAPTAAGTYTVAGTVSDGSYTGSGTATLVISKATAPVTLSNLAQTYTGSPLPATETTVPSGLTAPLTYTGSGSTTYGPSSTAPTLAGTYAVSATVNDPNYTGSGTGMLVISQAAATLTLSSLAQTYTGSPLSATATTAPNGLTATLTYTGTNGTIYGPSTTPPTAAGSYTVGGALSDPNYTGTANATLVISPAPATVTLGNLAQTYTGSPLPATVTSAPTGLAVNLTYTSSTYGPSAAPPTAPGSYSVSATVNDPNYSGTANATLVIVKAPATVTLSNLAQTYTGSPLPATETSAPTGLTVPLTYTGTNYGPSTVAPTVPGSYTVSGTVNDPNYTGTASGTLVIAKAPATVTLGNLAQTYTGSPLAATDTTAPTNLTVVLTYTGTENGPPYGPSTTPPTLPGSYTVSGTVNDPNYTGTGTGTLVITKAAATVTLSNLTQNYTGSPLAATAITAPPELAVRLTYTSTNGTTYGPSTTPPTLPGSYTVSAAVTDPNYTGTGTGTLVITKAAATVTLSNLAQTYTGSPLPATATTAPANLSVTLTYNGSATLPVAAGSYTVVATITSPTFAGTATGTLVISKVAAAIVLTSSVNPGVSLNPVTFTATVSSTIGKPTGAVLFLDGTTPLAQATITGATATLTTASLSVGSHAITAQYIGDTNFTSALSPVLTEAVLDFNLTPTTGSSTGTQTAAPTTQTAPPGGTATYDLSIVPTAGAIFPTPVTLTVTGMPAGATAAIAPATWTQLTATSWSYPAGTPINDLFLKVQLPAASALAHPQELTPSKLPPLLWGLLLLPFAATMRRAARRLSRALALLLLFTASMAALVSLSGCGTTSGLYVETGKTYIVTVTATAGPLTHSTDLTLTVKSAQ